ncbi:MAG: outer membrane beta-barrel protein [Bacteroidota bacterium]|nr:outer membrane beta-barrel protein [Bacteroidota bacterium]
MKHFLLLLAGLLTIGVYAQEYRISGRLVDSTSYSFLPGATITLSSSSDTANVKYTISDNRGRFVFDQLEPQTYHLRISYIGYHTLLKIIALDTNNLVLGMISLRQKVESLDDIEVIDQVPMATLKGDTVQFNADAFKVNPDATAEDLVRKMPGIIIEDGTVKAQGEEVQKVLVDGRQFFGDDPNLALKTLPAEVIQKIEVFDKLSEQAEFTGFDDGQSVKTMNIVTRPETRNGKFGRVYGGYGTDNRYTAGGNINFFNDDQRISILGLSNNINQQNFGSQDLLGVMSSSSRRRGPPGRGGMGGRGGGGMSSYGGGSANNFMVGPQDGITTTHSAGVNYTDEWSENIEINASYFFNATRNISEAISSTEYIIPGDSNQFYDEVSDGETENYNHRFNVRFKWDIDSLNSLILRPRLNFQTNNYNSNVAGITFMSSEELLNNTTNTYKDHSFGYNFNNDLLFRHAFRKRGRTFSVNVGTGFNSNSSDNQLMAINQYYYEPGSQDDTINQRSDIESGGLNLSANFIYTEPVADQGQVSVNYNSSYRKSESDKATFNYDVLNAEYDILDTTLSNRFDNDYFTNRLGASYRFFNRKVMLMAGLAYQRADLISKQAFPRLADLDQTFDNILPNAMLRYMFSRSTNLRVFYRSQTQAPSISQLQNVIDNSDPLNITAGNPGLKQEYSNMLISRYSVTNTAKSKFFFVMLFLRNTQNYISSSTLVASRDTIIGNGILMNKGSQLTIPMNVDGYWNARTFITYGLPIEKIKSNMNLNVGITYSRTPGMINQTQNISHTMNLSLGAVLGSNISENIDFTFSYNGSVNFVTNSVQENQNNDYYYQTIGLRFNWIFWKAMVFRNDFTHKLYLGLADILNQDYLIWNIQIGKKFLKDNRAELSIGVYDLLNQNKSIKRTVTETSVQDSGTQVLQRYLMLTFTYNFKNFTGNENSSFDRPAYDRGHPPRERPMF